MSYTFVPFPVKLGIPAPTVSGDTDLPYSPNPTIRAALDADIPLLYDQSTGVFSLSIASVSGDGYISHTDWQRFNAGATAFTYTDVVDSSQAMIPGNGYYADDITLVTFTLPVTATKGSVMEIIGIGQGGWRLVQNTGQIVHFGDIDTTVTNGYLQSTQRRDCVKLLCVVANIEFQVISSVGNITFY